MLVSDYALSAVLDWPGLTGGALPSYCCDVRGGKLQINVSQSLSDLDLCPVQKIPLCLIAFHPKFDSDFYKL